MNFLKKKRKEKKISRVNQRGKKTENIKNLRPKEYNKNV